MSCYVVFGFIIWAAIWATVRGVFVWLFWLYYCYIVVLFVPNLVH